MQKHIEIGVSNPICDLGKISSCTNLKDDKSNGETDGYISESKTLDAVEHLKSEDSLQQFGTSVESPNQIEIAIEGQENENCLNKQQIRIASNDSVNQPEHTLQKLNDMLHLSMKEVPEYNEKEDYYGLYWSTFLDNQRLLEELKSKIEKRNRQLSDMMRIQEKIDSTSNVYVKYAHRKKHIRRAAIQMTREKLCPYSNGGKYYGSEGSLILHMKLKHHGGNKTDRDKLSKALVEAYISRKPFPEITVNIPKSAIEEQSINMSLGLTAQQISDIHKIAEYKFKERVK